MRAAILLVAFAFVGSACLKDVANKNAPSPKGSSSNNNDDGNSSGTNGPGTGVGSRNPTSDEPVEPAEPPPPSLSTGAPAVPLRRLTEEELNNTLRDLFEGVALPHVALNDGEDPSNRGGFEGDVSRQTPSDLMVEQLRAASMQVAEVAVQHKDAWLPSDDGHEVVATFGARALRRPLKVRERVAYNTLFDDALASVGFDGALQVTVSALLQAPSFIYRIETGGAPSDEYDGAVALDSYEMASRLSYLLWASMPDKELFDAAADDALSTPEEIELQARRMIEDPRAKVALLSFHRQWLDLDRVLEQERDVATYPHWSEALRDSMRREADAFVENVMVDGDARLRTLLTSTTTRVNAALASLYGVEPPANDWDLVELPGQERAGVITQAAFLTTRAHAINPSPVLRGVFILDRFLCMAPPPPSGDISTVPPTADPNVPTTNRQRYAQHTFDPVCQACHEGIDGIGMGLESYDATGKFRAQDNGFDVDASGDLSSVGAGGDFEGGVALANALADSALVEECVARQWLSYARGRGEDSVDWPHILEVADRFHQHDGDVRELLVAIVTSPSFRFIPQVDP